MSDTAEQKVPSKPELSKWEFDEMITWFDNFDKDRDGKLSRKELTKVFNAKCWTFSDKDIDKIFKDAGNEELDANAYEKMLSSFRKSKEVEKMDLLKDFQKFDTQHKGYIAKRQILEYFSDDDVPNLHKVIKKLDPENTGKINPNEFVEALLED